MERNAYSGVWTYFDRKTFNHRMALCKRKVQSTTHEDWRHELAPGIYVWTDNSTATKISILHGMFEECNIPASELVFEFRSLVQEGDCEE